MSVLTSDRQKPSVGISWKDITFKIKAKKGMVADKDGFVELVHGLSGFANPGQVLAIMGGSGAGKTTLLNILSDRLANPKNTRISGEVMANGQNTKSIAYETYVGYVMQDDILLDTLTVRECLQFSADMRLFGTKEEKKAKVDILLEDLKLTEVADNRIGSHMIKGVSGGERRRASIGVELITEPSVVFLDEPTSGLDSFTALTVMKVLSNLAQQGMTIICTIHQPSTEIFNLFDRLMLLSEGHTVYMGPAQSSRHYFDKLNFKCPRLTNPADYFMKILHVVDRHNMTPEESERINFLIKSYKETTNAEEQNRETEQFQELSRNDFHYKAGFFAQLKPLMGRSIKNMKRSPIIIRVRAGQIMIFAIISIAIFNDLGSGSSAVQNRVGVLFFTILTMFMSGVQNAMLSFPVERSLFLKEQAQKMYGVIPYFQAKTLSELPVQIILPCIFSAVVYFAVKLNLYSVSKYFIFLLLVLLTHLSGSSYGLLIGSLFSDMRVALNAGPLLIVPLILFGGFFVNQNSIPKAWIWVSYIDPLRYSFQAFVINEFTDLTLDCSHNNPPCDPLSELDFGEGLWTSVWVLIGLTVGIRILSAFFLKLLVRKLGS